MAIDVASLEGLVQKVVDSGARVCVLADLTGLVVVSASESEKASEEEDRLFSAISSMVLAMGEDVAREIGGDLLSATVRTTQSTLLATAIPGKPPTVLITIVDKEALRRQVEGEMERLKSAISGATMGIATEVRVETKTKSVDTSRLESFFSTLILDIDKHEDAEALAYLIEKAKDDFLEALSGYGPVTYSMGSFARQLRNRKSEPIEALRKDTLSQINAWKEQLLPEETDSESETAK